MKQYIKSFLLMLLVGCAFASCTDQFDEDGGQIVYPQTAPQGTWVSEYTPDTNPYTYEFTTSENGDCTFTMIAKDGTEEPRVSTNGVMTYDATYGVAEIAFDAEHSALGQEMVLYVAYQDGAQRTACKLHMGGSALPSISFNAVQK